MAITRQSLRESARKGNGLTLIDAPWRHKLFDDKKAYGECFVCRAIADNPRNDRRNLLLVRGERAVIVLNRYPYTMGALMIAPVEHTGDYLGLGDSTLAEINRMLKLGIRILDKAVQPRAYNIGLNLGVDAGAGLAEHLHYHLVPRWTADTNFMTTTGNVRVLAEDVDSMFLRLRRAQRALEKEKLHKP